MEFQEEKSNKVTKNNEITLQIKNQAIITNNDILEKESKSPLFTKNNIAYFGKHCKSIMNDPGAFFKYIDNTTSSSSSPLLLLPQILEKEKKYIKFKIQDINHIIHQKCHLLFKNKENQDSLKCVLVILQNQHGLPPEYIANVAANLLLLFPPKFVIIIIHLLSKSPKYRYSMFWSSNDGALEIECNVMMKMIEFIDPNFYASLITKEINCIPLLKDIIINIGFNLFEMTQCIPFFIKCLKQGHLFIIEFCVGLLLSNQELIKSKRGNVLTFAKLIEISYNEFYKTLCQNDDQLKSKKSGFTKFDKKILLYNNTMKYLQRDNIIGSAASMIGFIRDEISKLNLTQNKNELAVVVHYNRYYRNISSNGTASCTNCGMCGDYKCVQENLIFCKRCVIKHNALHSVKQLALIQEENFL